MQPPSVAIAYYSGRGHTAALAEAVAAGVGDASATATVLAVDKMDEPGWAVLDGADAIIFGSPTYMGNVSAGFQTFAESTSGRCMSGAWRDKVAAGFTNSGGKSGDKLHSLMSILVLAAQQHMHWVNLGLAPGWTSSTSSEHDLNRLAFWLGAAAQTDTDVSAGHMHGSDVLTCRHLGRRVAEVTAQLLAGRSGARDRSRGELLSSARSAE
ncbi:MAG TPA: flavodoxin family protein [Pseudonocardia sp.]|jgi:NAD(P)H dehydrogenase (quinone)|nr:flavodoxin family protein [Pseudonocardia sp.]